MSGQSNNKIIFGSAAGLFAVVALVWFFTRSGGAVEPSTFIPQPTVTMTEDEPVGRSQPRGSTGGARLGGAATAAGVDEDDGAVTQKSKNKRSKKRQRRKQQRDDEEKQDTGTSKGKKQKYFGK